MLKEKLPTKIFFMLIPLRCAMELWVFSAEIGRRLGATCLSGRGPSNAALIIPDHENHCATAPIPDSPITDSSSLHCVEFLNLSYTCNSNPHGSLKEVVFSSNVDLNRAQRALKSAAESLFSVLFPSDCRDR